MINLLSIAVGGALGAVSRHGLNVGITAWVQQPFPVATLIINVLGSFAMGVLIALFASTYNPSQEIKLFLTVGFLGGFTTFSTFSLDAVSLLNTGRFLDFSLYVLASVILSIGALLLGSFLIWRITA